MIRAGSAMAVLALAAVVAVLLPVGAASLRAAPAASPPVAGHSSEAGTAPAGVRPVPGVVLAEFDPPAHRYGPGRRGVRLAAPEGAAVRSVRAGRVAFAGLVAATPWVTVDHGGGLLTSYGPVEPAVVEGQAVAAGDVIGRLVGGSAEGLHWGARVDGRYVDPLDLLGRWRPVLLPREEAAAP